MLLRPVHAESAAVHQHDDERLATHSKRLDQVFFRLWQIKARTVPAGKAGLTHRHFFPFKAAGDADDGDDDIGVLGSSHCRGIGHVVHGTP